MTDNLKTHGATGKTLQPVFCSTACFEAACDIEGVSHVDEGTLALFRATWLERDRRHRARLLLDPTIVEESLTVVPDEGPVPLKAAVASVMADTFFCATSREMDKVTQEIRRIVSAAKSWQEYMWLVYIGRKTYSLEAVCALLEGPGRLRYDRGTINADELDVLLSQTSLGDGILHGESKQELRERIIGMRDLLHSLPAGFLNGSADDLEQTARIFKQRSARKAGDKSTIIFQMPHATADNWPKMSTTDRLWAFFMAIGGTSHFHAWQMCMDLPPDVCDSASMRAVGPSCYIFLRLTYPDVKFPSTWSSAQCQALAIRLVEHLRTRPELHGLHFPGPMLSFNDTEHWCCETLKAAKALYNADLLSRVGEVQHVLNDSVLPPPARGKFRTRRFRSGIAAATSSTLTNNLLYMPRQTSSTNLMKGADGGEPRTKRQASLKAFIVGRS